jgi:hypothetical protein
MRCALADAEFGRHAGPVQPLRIADLLVEIEIERDDEHERSPVLGCQEQARQEQAWDEELFLQAAGALAKRLSGERQRPRATLSVTRDWHRCHP